MTGLLRLGTVGTTLVTVVRLVGVLVPRPLPSIVVVVVGVVLVPPPVLVGP